MKRNVNHLRRCSVAVLLIIVILAAAAISGCRKKRTEMEQLTVETIAPWCRYLEDYNLDHQYYPETWGELVRYKGIPMPENPYTGEPMVALESSEFDPDVSPGNFYYMRVIRDEIVVNCQVLIFGDRGLITRYCHSPLAAR